MSLLSICQWIQETPFSTVLRESIWGFPILGALHVLGVAGFGGALFAPAGELRGWKHAGLAVMLLTGAVLFCIEPLKCYHSAGFWLKMGLLVLIGLTSRGPRASRAFSLILWAAVIFAARAIAFF